MPRMLCAQCQRPEPVCYCHLLPVINNHTPVKILQHKNEQAHAINTAKIAAMSLQNCQLLSVGDEFHDGSLQSELAHGQQIPILIYPRQNSILLEPGMFPVETPLLFIDANWRKSRRLLLQSDFLQDLPCFHLDIGRESRYRIRKEPAPGNISTLEAIVYSLSLQRNEGVESMLDVMDWMISKQLEYMPKNLGQDGQCD